MPTIAAAASATTADAASRLRRHAGRPSHLRMSRAPAFQTERTEIVCMNRRDFLAGGLASPLAFNPQPSCSATLLDDHSVICSAFGYPNFRYTKSVSPAPNEAIQATQLILDSVGLQRNFEVLAGKFSGSVGGFATMRHGKRYIVYDADRFSFANGRTDWDAMGLLGHEIGHHLGTHLHATDISDKNQELEADRFAGFVLSRLGASEAQSLIWTDDLNELDTPTHPARAVRRQASLEGWKLGEAVKRRERPSCTPGWLNEQMELDGRICGIARTCDASSGAKTRLACQDYLGEWRWMSE